MGALLRRLGMGRARVDRRSSPAAGRRPGGVADLLHDPYARLGLMVGPAPQAGVPTTF